jgi:hypothetical protein
MRVRKLLIVKGLNVGDEREGCGKPKREPRVKNPEVEADDGGQDWWAMGNGNI